MSGLSGVFGFDPVGANVETEHQDTTGNAAPGFVAEHWNDTTTLLRQQSDDDVEYTGPGSPSADGVPEIFEVSYVRIEDIPADYPDSETPNSVDNFVYLVEKVEQAYPDMSREEVLAGLRRLGGYDDAIFQRLYGTDPGFNIEPAGDLTQTDIDLLDDMIQHSVDDDGTERGLIVDRDGEEVAAGHVLTGLQAGLNYNSEADLNPGGWTGTFGQQKNYTGHGINAGRKNASIFA